MVISQKACAVAEKLCTLISVDEPPTICQICSEHLAHFVASGGIGPPSTVPGQHLKAVVPESPESATQGTADSSATSTDLPEALNKPPTHAEQVLQAIEEIELGVAIENSKVGDTAPVAEAKGTSAKGKKPPKAGKGGAKKGGRLVAEAGTKPSAHKAGKAKVQADESATPALEQDEEPQKESANQAECLSGFGSGDTDSPGSRSSFGTASPPKYDHRGEGIGSGGPLPAEIHKLSGKWWRVWVSSTRLNQYAIETPHTGVFLFCFCFPGKARSGMVAGASGVQVYSNLLDLTFNVPETFFRVKQPTDILDRHTLDLFIDGLWETSGDEREGCDPEGIPYDFVPSVHTALHGDDESDAIKPTGKEAQSAAQKQATRVLLEEMEQGQRAATAFAKGREEDGAPLGSNRGFTGARGLPSPVRPSGTSPPSFQAPREPKGSDTHQACATRAGRQSTHNMSWTHQQQRNSLGEQLRETAGFRPRAGRSPPRRTTGEWAQQSSPTNNQREGYRCILVCGNTVPTEGQMCDSCVANTCECLGCPNPRMRDSIYCEECLDELTQQGYTRCLREHCLSLIGPEQLRCRDCNTLKKLTRVTRLTCTTCGKVQIAKPNATLRCDCGADPTQEPGHTTHIPGPTQRSRGGASGGPPDDPGGDDSDDSSDGAGKGPKGPGQGAGSPGDGRDSNRDSD